MAISVRLFVIIAALWVCVSNASMATRVVTAATARVQTPTPTVDRAVTSTNAGISTSKTKTTSRTRQLVRTTVLFPLIQSQYPLGVITADLIDQKGGTSTFVATACTSTTISNSVACVSMPPVTYSLGKSTLLYSGTDGSVNCKFNVKSAKPTQTCTIVKPVYAPDVITTGTVKPTVAPLRSETSSTFWIGTATGYVYADIWGNAAGVLKVQSWVCGMVATLAVILINIL